MKTSRRDFLRMAGAATATGLVPTSPATVYTGLQPRETAVGRLDLGMASYTFRAFPLDDAIRMTRRLGVTKITLKEMHLPLKSTGEELAVAREKMKAAGLDFDSVGVIYMKTEDEVRQAFAYAKSAGVRTIIGAPDAPLLPIAERLVRETDIILAIHNHGPTDKRYPTPESAFKAIENLDKRIGLCVDVGHTQRHGLDPSVEIERFFDRVYDIHVKDVDRSEAVGKTVEIGRGVIDIPKFFRTISRLKYSHTLHLEFEKDQDDPLPGTAESLGYARGVLAGL